MTYTKEQLREELNTMRPYEVQEVDVTKLEKWKQVPETWNIDDTMLFGQRRKLDFYKVRGYLVMLDRNKLHLTHNEKYKRYGKYDNYLRDTWSSQIANCCGTGLGDTEHYFIPKKVLIKRLREKERQ